MSAHEPQVIDRLAKAFDWHDPEYTPDVAESVNEKIRENGAVTYSPAHGGFWIISRYRHVKAALRDHETFSSTYGVHFPRAAGMPKFSPIDYDPPEHRSIRDLMAPPVQHEKVRGLEPSLQSLAAELLEPIVSRGHGDLHEEFARPFAVAALGFAIGLSPDAQREIRALTGKMWKHLSSDSDSSKFWPAYHALLSDEIKRARDGDGDRYLAQLAKTRINGEPLPDEQLYSIIVSFCVAGHDNTMNSLSRVLWLLGKDTDLQKRIRSEDNLIPAVAEEALRRWCPTDRFTRVTTRDVEIDGVWIPQGARVVLLFDAANRDPEIFPEPDEFAPERGNSHHHLSFGFGIHHCLGAHLARTEFRTVLTEFGRHPIYRLTEEPDRYFENGRHVMFERVPVRFDRPNE